MAFKTPSNKRIHPQNGKVVNTAIKTIQTTAAISQEKYWNAFRVDGHTCHVYNFLKQGKICSCSASTKHNVMKPILDEEGNAPRDFINTMLGGGIISGNSNYGEDMPLATSPSVRIKQLDTLGAQSLQSHFVTNADSANVDFIEEDFSDDFLENEISVTSTTRCGICYGSGYVGGFNLCFGNRFVLDSTHKDLYLFGYSVHQENLPNTFENSGALESYILFTITLPLYIYQVSSFTLRNNIDDVFGKIEASLDNITFVILTIDNLKDFCIGIPIYIRISEINTFTHLEFDFLVSNENTYLEYPILNQTGDVTQLIAIGDVTIYVSPTIPIVSEKDIVIDNTWGKAWRVLTVNNHKDRNVNIHGWEITARLIQEFEVYSYLPTNKTLQRQLNVNLNRW